jgi:hypothetical protein
MTRRVVIALAVAVLVIGGFAVYSRKKAGLKLNPFAIPPYASAGPSPYNPNGPPLGTAGKIGETAQQVNSAIQGGAGVIMAGKKAWDDIAGLFGGSSTDDSIDEGYVDGLPQ